MRLSSFCIALLLLASAPYSMLDMSFAEPLPKSAKPLSASEVRSLYADRTTRGGVDSCTDGDTALVKWFADGRVRGISSVSPHGLDHIWWGKWWTKASSMCMKITKHYVRSDKQKSEYRCWDFYKTDNGVYTIMSSCPTRRYGANDYWKFGKLSKGDLTAATYDKLYQKYVKD